MDEVWEEEKLQHVIHERVARLNFSAFHRIAG